MWIIYPHLEEGGVHEAGVVVDELKEEHLEGVAVLVVGLGPRVLPVRDLAGDDLERTQKWFTEIGKKVCKSC